MRAWSSSRHIKPSMTATMERGHELCRQAALRLRQHCLHRYKALGSRWMNGFSGRPHNYGRAHMSTVPRRTPTQPKSPKMMAIPAWLRCCWPIASTAPYSAAAILVQLRRRPKRLSHSHGRPKCPPRLLLSLNSLALAIAELDPPRARALLQEGVEHSSVLGEEITGGLLTACMVSGRLRDWELTLSLAGRSFINDRWALAAAQVATTLAECARAFAERRPNVAGLLTGAAYHAFALANPMAQGRRQSRPSSEGNFVLEAVREASDIVSRQLGDEKRRELTASGAAMSMDEAVSYALANIDPRLLNGPVVFRD